LDGLDSTQFLRSDVDDTANGNIGFDVNSPQAKIHVATNAGSVTANPFQSLIVSEETSPTEFNSMTFATQESGTSGLVFINTDDDSTDAAFAYSHLDNQFLWVDSTLAPAMILGTDGNLIVSTGVSTPFFFGNGSNITSVNASQLNSQLGSYYLDRTNHTGTQTASTISDFNEASQDSVGGSLTNSSTVTFTYNDAGNAISAGFASMNISQFYNDVGYPVSLTATDPISVTTGNNFF
jgi:hypothetical protein